MYLFLNHFAFIEPKDDLTDSEIIIALENLANLFNELKELNVHLIIHQQLSQSILNDKHIREYIKKIIDRNIKMSLLHLVGKLTPICSNIDTPYDSNESIIDDNCFEEKENIEILETFISCAIYYNNPILTIDNMCSKVQFLEDSINIVCDNNTYKLDNYKLIPYIEVLEKVKIYQKEKLIDKCDKIDNWAEYQDFVNNNLKYSKITNHCIKMLEKNHSYTNSHSNDFRNKVKRIDELINLNGGKPQKVDFNKLSKKHYSPESISRFNNLKKSHSGIQNYKKENIYLNWHTWVQDYRVYFEKEDEYISFVHYEKKIS